MLPGCGKCTGQERCLTICAKEITEEKIGLIYVVVLFDRAVIFNWGNFTSCFFQSNDKWVYAFNRNFFFQVLLIIIFLHKETFFSYNNV